jgi:DNA replication protein DnaC
VLIVGIPRVGKTHFGTALFLEEMKRSQIPGLWTDASLALDRIKDDFATHSTRTKDQIMGQSGRNILMLDALGREQRSDFSVSFFRNVLVHRSHAMMPTVITAPGLNEQDLAYLGSEIPHKMKEEAAVIGLDDSDEV